MQQYNLILRAIFLFSYASIPLVGLYWTQLKECIRKRWQLFILVFLAIISLFWSHNIYITFSHLYLLICATLYGFLLSRRYRFATVLRLLAIAMAIIILSSYVSIVAGFEWAVMEDLSGAWRGIMPHKNILGSISALAFITFIIVAHRSPSSQRLGWWFLASIAAILMIGSRSATALLAFVTVTVTWMAIKGLALLPRQSRTYGIALGSSFFVPCGAALVLYWPEIAALLGRDVGLTGRLPLWISLLRIGLTEPLLGHGYGVWLDSASMTSIDKVMIIKKYPWASHAHNGLLEIWLDLGFVGLICVLLPILTLLVRSMRIILLQKKDQQYHFAFLFLVFWITNNFSESLLAKCDLYKAFFWVIFSWLYFSEEVHTM